MKYFDNKSVKRIADTVKWVEQEVKVQPPKADSKGRRTVGFWAKITGQSGHKYSWEALEPDTGDTLTANSDWRSGTTSEGYAVDSKHLSEHVINNSTVWLTPAPSETHYYYFQYTPSAKVGTTPASASVIGTVSVTLDSSEVVSASNILYASIPASSSVLLVYKDGIWVIAAVAPELQQVITDIQVSGNTLQYKSRDVLIIPAGDESAWYTFHTGTECS